VSKRIPADSSTAARTYVGSLGYMAPEIFSLKSAEAYYTNAVDLWALGCTLFRMVTGKIPFLAVSDIVLYQFGRRSFPRSDLEFVDMSKSGLQFIEGLLHPDPTHRMTAKAALEHDWISTEPSEFQVIEELVCYFDSVVGE
ncbi:kinase-like domain-containing protein, partial [Trichophaea hybrida]